MVDEKYRAITKRYIIEAEGTITVLLQNLHDQWQNIRNGIHYDAIMGYV